MENLSDEVLFEVFRMLTPDDCINSALTCKKWKQHYDTYKKWYNNYRVSRYYNISSNRSLCRRLPIKTQLEHMLTDISRRCNKRFPIYQELEKCDIVFDMRPKSFRKHHAVLFAKMIKVFKVLKKIKVLTAFHIKNLSINRLPSRVERKHLTNALINVLRLHLYQLVNCSLRGANLATDRARKLFRNFRRNVNPNCLRWPAKPALALTHLDIVNVVHVDMNTTHGDVKVVQDELYLTLGQLINLRQLHILIMWLTPKLLQHIVSKCQSLAYLELHMNGASTQCDVTAADWREATSQLGGRRLQVHVTVSDVSDVEAVMGVMVEHMPVVTFRMVNQSQAHVDSVGSLITHLATTYHRTLSKL